MKQAIITCGDIHKSSVYVFQLANGIVYVNDPNQIYSNDQEIEFTGDIHNIVQLIRARLIESYIEGTIAQEDVMTVEELCEFYKLIIVE